MSTNAIPASVSQLPEPILYDTIETYIHDSIWTAQDSGKSVSSLNALREYLHQLPQTYDQYGNPQMGHFYMARSDEAPAICLVHGECPSGAFLPNVIEQIKDIINDVFEDGLFWYCCTRCGKKDLQMRQTGNWDFDPTSGPSDSIQWIAVCSCGHTMNLF